LTLSDEYGPSTAELTQHGPPSCAGSPGRTTLDGVHPVTGRYHLLVMTLDSRVKIYRERPIMRGMIKTWGSSWD
jgi:hypothetical protein